LWLDALGVAHSEDHALVAAAIECLHNASLHHDDILDEHDSRRGVDTIRALSGAPGAVLAGDGLIGAAMRSLTLLERLDTRIMLAFLGQAWSRMNRGQLMDQPEVWRNIPGDNLETHWHRMTRDKLAIGNVAAPLAAVCAGKHDLIDRLCTTHEEFSVVSQILNDIGDLYGWSGFHALAPCKRKRGHEAELKPTIATIWRARATSQGPDEQAKGLVVLAHQRVSRLTKRALERLRAIECKTDAKEVLLDFFTRPLTEFDRVIAEGWAE
jgi:geranylgeranyl pyrophosphate synthase